MYIFSLAIILLSSVSATPAPFSHNHFSRSHVASQKRNLTPDNTCGGTNAYICNPSDPYGGRCCSASGWCGNADTYCGTGCQSAFGSCGSSSSGPGSNTAAASPQASATPEPQSYGPAVTGNSLAPNKEGCMWAVDGAGSFTHSKIFDFSALPSFPNGDDDLSISTDPIGSSPYTQLYTTSNVAVSSDSLQLKVPGGQTASPILGAEISTKHQDILYGSVRTTMKASTVAGTCHGAFFYKDDNHEVDVEIITGNRWKGVHYTNQRASAESKPSTLLKSLPSDATSVFQEYRIDWLPGRTDFYLDGKLQKSLTENVPSIAGSWLWNNWSNGDPGWTGAPPLQDNIMEISRIEMYYNRTGSAGTC